MLTMQWTTFLSGNKVFGKNRVFNQKSQISVKKFQTYILDIKVSTFDYQNSFTVE